MEYKIKEHVQANKKLMDTRHQLWSYISLKEMEILFPNGGYIIAGDLKKEKKENSIGILLGENQSIDIFPYVSKLRMTEKIVGYINVDDREHNDVFIRIIKRTYKKYLFILLFLFFAIALIGGLIFLNSTKDKPNLDENAISYHVDGLVNKDPSNISVPLFTQINIDKSTMKGAVHLANPEGNPCYFEYHIILKEDNTEIYRSDLLEPGTAVPNFKVNRELNEGIYPALMQIKTYSLNNHNVPMNGGDIDINLVVKEEN